MNRPLSHLGLRFVFLLSEEISLFFSFAEKAHGTNTERGKKTLVHKIFIIILSQSRWIYFWGVLSYN